MSDAHNSYSSILTDVAIIGCLTLEHSQEVPANGTDIKSMTRSKCMHRNQHKSLGIVEDWDSL